MKNYYHILGLKRNASKEDIKHAYRNLAFKYHPDRNSDENQMEMFNDINEAKHVLLDDLKRAQHDEDTEKKGLAPDFFRSLNFFGARQQKGFKSYSGQERYFKNSRVLKKPVYIFALTTFILITAIFLITERESEPAFIVANSNEVPVEIPVNIPDKKSDTSAQLLTLLDTSAASYDKVEEPEKSTHTIPVIEANKKLKNPEIAAASTDVNKELKIRKPETKKEAAITTLVEVKKAKLSVTGLTNSKPVTSKPDSGNTAPAVKPAEELVEKQMSPQEMKTILNDINNEKERLHNKSNCVQIRKTKTSNAANGFKLAEFLSSNGFIISGRETVSSTSTGINIDANGGCIKVTIGTL